MSCYNSNNSSHDDFPENNENMPVDNYDDNYYNDSLVGSGDLIGSSVNANNMVQNVVSSGYKTVDRQYHNAKRFAWKHLGWVVLILVVLALYWLYTNNYLSTLSAKLETLSPQLNKLTGLSGGGFRYQTPNVASYYVDRVFQ